MQSADRVTLTLTVAEWQGLQECLLDVVARRSLGFFNAINNALIEHQRSEQLTEPFRPHAVDRET